MTPSEPVASEHMTGGPGAVAEAPERRLHPWSWLFVLLAQLKQFIVPLVALLFFGRGSSSGNVSNELWPLIGVGVLALTSVLQYFTYRYRIGSDGISIRSGWLHRSRREIPFARIHNVAVQQTLLHRLFGVAELRLESAGSNKPEAQMRVLRMDDALALEQVIRHRGHAPVAGATPAAADDVLLALPPTEVLRLGLISNRGVVVIGAAFAGASQMSPRLIPNLFESWGEALFGWAGAQHFGPVQYALAAISLLLAFVVLLRLLSVALALLQYYGFRLTEQGHRLTVERGLLARFRTSAARRRIQAWTLHEGMLHRWFKRRSLHVDSAAGDEQQQQRSLRELAPIATPQACAALIAHLLPDAAWDALQWQPLHARAWRRLFLPGAVFALAATAALTWRFDGWGLLMLLWLPWSAYAARQNADRAGYALNERLVAVRGGWWSRHWRFAELDKLQALRLSQTPFDRRHGMATLWLDTAGASAMAPPLRIRYIAEAEARELQARLAHTLARRKLQW
jgi:putative membrane protein